MADHLLALLRRLMSWYASRGVDFRSPIVRGMAKTKPKDRARHRTLEDHKLRAVWRFGEAAGIRGVGRENRHSRQLATGTGHHHCRSLTLQPSSLSSPARCQWAVGSCAALGRVLNYTRLVASALGAISSTLTRVKPFWRKNT
jgi:hypothetical protein